jgi:hypothetical protein
LEEPGIIFDISNWGIRSDRNLVASIRDAMIGEFYGYAGLTVTNLIMVWNKIPENINDQIKLEKIKDEVDTLIYEYALKLHGVLDRHAVE